MDDVTKSIARDIAANLEGSGHKELRLQVEETLAAREGRHLNDTIALAALVVSTASFAWRTAWDLYTEARKRAKDAEADKELRAAVERAVKEEVASAPLEDQAARSSLVEAATNVVMARLARHT